MIAFLMTMSWLRTPLRVCLLASVVLWTSSVSRPVRADDAVAHDRSMRMFRDPQTGAVGRPSAAALRAEGGASRAAAPAAAPLEEPVRGPAGGVKVHLGRAQRPAVERHADPDGAVVHECLGGGGAGDE